MIDQIVLALFCIPLLMWAYRYHGQVHPNENDTIVRLVFVSTLCFTVTLLVLVPEHTQAIKHMGWYLLFLPVLSFIAIQIPHAYCQDLGRNPKPENKWPSFFLPTHTQIEWDQLSQLERTLADTCYMAGVGLFTGLILAGPTILFGVSFLRMLWSVWFFIVGMPLCYVLGHRTKFIIPKSTDTGSIYADAYSTDWAELYMGALYFIAFYNLIPS